MPFICVTAKRWDGPTNITGHTAINEDVVSLLEARPKKATADGPYRFETPQPPVKVLDCLEGLGFRLVTQTLNANTSSKAWTMQKC
ncbi:unnamed protein product, partial [Mesorhabditis belari]|uniref:GTP cyclohydrolase 1 feedback regulatory protein n=1 Tax=Mesorhabditis belari TaxID=2138241 RepID=A0AAF3F0X0_9BILA